jgi:alpha-tubulin suppressor-like RCC1 family protein
VKSTQNCGSAALCDPAGQVCETPPTIALGGSRGCAIDGGSVYCWGLNGGSPTTFGTLFVDDSHLNFYSAAQVTGLTSPVQVAVADNFQCALAADGSITCWGDNQFGNLGTDDSVATNTLTVNNEVAVEIGVAPWCSCARMADATGSVWCWGLQDNGCLGDGINSGNGVGIATPTQVPLTAPAVQIRIGDGDNTPSCARLANKQVECWGQGFGPTKVPGVNDADEIAVGWGWVWIRRPGGVYVTYLVPPPSGGGGGGGSGGAGGAAADGGADAGVPGYTFAPPVKYLSAGLATQMAAGNSFCAIETGNVVSCFLVWDFSGGPTMFPQPTSVAVPSKSVYCWGKDDSGGLGVGGPEYPDTPQDLTFVPTATSTVTSVTCGESSTAATFMDGSARYWGNGDAYLPNNPPQLNTPSPPLGNLATKNALLRQRDGWGALMDMKTGGAAAQLLEGGNLASGMRLLAWSATNYTDAFPGLLNNQVDLGLVNGQIIVSWTINPDGGPAGNIHGLFGEGDFNTPAGPVLQPVPLPTGSTATALAAYATDYNDSPAHACAIVNTTGTTGALYCWGSNMSGESAVDIDPLPDVDTPTQVTLPGVTKPVVSVATGFAFACATDGPSGTGQVYCWGMNDQGQLGNGGYSQNPNPVPAAVQGINNGGATVPAVGVAAGDTHACAWLKDGSVMCWGCNDVGQLGSGDYDTQPVATPVTGLANVTSVSAYSDHTCAITNGSVACWGDSYNGQVGNGTSATYTTPTMVVGLP